MLDAGPTRNLGFRGPFIDPKYGSGLKGWNSPKAGALRDNEEESHCAKCFSLGGPAQCWSHEVWRTLHLQPWEGSSRLYFRSVGRPQSCQLHLHLRDMCTYIWFYTLSDETCSRDLSQLQTLLFFLHPKQTRFRSGVQEQNMLQVQTFESRPEVRERGSSALGLEP